MVDKRITELDLDVPVDGDYGVHVDDPTGTPKTSRHDISKSAVAPRPGKVNIGTVEYDTVAAAISAAISGDLIWVGEETYTCDYQTLPAGVHIMGMGVDRTILQTTSSTRTLIVGSGCTVSDLTVDNTQSNASPIMALRVSGSADIWNVKAAATNSHASAIATGLLVAASGITVFHTDCQFEASSTGGGEKAAWVLSNSTDIFYSCRFNCSNMNLDIDGATAVVALLACRLEAGGSISAVGGATVRGFYEDVSAGEIILLGDNQVDFKTGGVSRMTLTDSGLALATGARITEFDDDTTLAADSATKGVTQHAVKGYVDTAWTNWTPTITQGVSVTLSVVFARYILDPNGEICHVEMRVSATSTGTGNNAIVIGGQPSAMQPVSVGAATICGTGIVLDQAVAYYVGALVPVTATDFRFIRDNTAAYIGQNPNFALVSGDSIAFTAKYKV